MNLPKGLRASARALAMHTGEPESTWMHRLVRFRDRVQCPTVAQILTMADALEMVRRDLIEDVVREWWTPPANKRTRRP